MENVNFFLGNLESLLWVELMHFLPSEGDFISDSDGFKFLVIGRIYVRPSRQWNIFLESVE